MISWRDRGKNSSGTPYTITEVMDKAGPTWREKFDKNQTLNGSSEKISFLSSLRLRGEVHPVNYTIEGLLSLLQCHGLLWVTFTGGEEGKTHARIVTGLQGRVDKATNSYNELTTLVKINDPFGPDPTVASHRYTMNFKTFREYYEQVIKDSGEQMQIVWNG